MRPEPKYRKGDTVKVVSCYDVFYEQLIGKTYEVSYASTDNGGLMPEGWSYFLVGTSWLFYEDDLELVNRPIGKPDNGKSTGLESQHQQADQREKFICNHATDCVWNASCPQRRMLSKRTKQSRRRRRSKERMANTRKGMEADISAYFSEAIFCRCFMCRSRQSHLSPGHVTSDDSGKFSKFLYDRGWRTGKMKGERGEIVGVFCPDCIRKHGLE